MPRVRLFIDQPFLASGAAIEITGGQAHYLVDVMRIAVGGEVRVFNGNNGEWRACLSERAKKTCTLRLESCLRPQQTEPGPWLLFALLKRDCTDLVVQKATELGAERLLPIITRHTGAHSTNAARLRAIALEAAEQCGRLTIPPVLPPAPLAGIAAAWPPERRLLVMTPGNTGIPFRELQATCLGARGTETDVAADLAPGIVIGPEGGLATTELDELVALPFVTAVSLGPLVLRAETAAIAALSCWQALAGRWAGQAAEGVR